MSRKTGQKKWYRGVTRLDGARARSKFGAPIVEPEVFRKQIYCIEASTCDIVGTFGAPRSDSAPPFSARGIVPPLPPSFHPRSGIQHRCKSRQIFGGAKDFCLDSSQTCPKKLQKNVTSEKKLIHVIWVLFFSNRNTLGAIFCSYFQGVYSGFQGFCERFQRFCPDFTDFARILRDFVRIFTKSIP